MKKQNIDILLVLGVLIVSFFLFKELKTTFKNLFGGVGLGTTTDDDEREENIQETGEKVSDYFDPNYWNKPKAKLLTIAESTSICKDIYDGVGYIYDTPTQIIGAFNRIKYKTQVSWIAYQFNRIYKRDLYTWLNEKLDTDEQRKAFLNILKRINSLPKGF